MYSDEEEEEEEEEDDAEEEFSEVNDEIFFLFSLTFILNLRRWIQLFWVGGWRPWPGVQSFELIWPKILLKICTNQVLTRLGRLLNCLTDEGANESGHNGACQGAKTRPTADQVSLEKGGTSFPFYSPAFSIKLMTLTPLKKGSRG